MGKKFPLILLIKRIWINPLKFFYYLKLIIPTNLGFYCFAFTINKNNEQKRGKKRMVINYISLNEIAIKFKYPISHKDTLLIHLTRSKIYNKFDCKNGFYQIKTKKKLEYVYKTTFNSTQGQYE
jgi:hypothetical protein